jgi:hypothetical protein
MLGRFDVQPNQVGVMLMNGEQPRLTSGGINHLVNLVTQHPVNRPQVVRVIH